MTNPHGRKVKVGVVGCGVVATAYYLPYLMRMDTVEIVAVCDRFAARTQACAPLFGAKQQYLDYDEMIEQADIEAVFILTAPGTQVRFSLKASAAGKHVLLQKPMATTLEDARQIGVDWGLHSTEMMVGAAESAATGQRYEMTTTLDY
jgi:predicted dehydrogenase